jgi:hypothetical protein
VTVTLCRPSNETWPTLQLAEYVDEIALSGSVGREAAQKKARRDDAGSLPDRLAATGQLRFRVEGGQPVSSLGLGLRNRRPEDGAH